MVDPRDLHRDLVKWGVLEPDSPVRFTRRFQGALARAAATLQAAEKGGQGTAGDAVGHLVETALAEFLNTQGKRFGPGHVRFVRALHVSLLPEAVRSALGL